MPVKNARINRLVCGILIVDKKISCTYDRKKEKICPIEVKSSNYMSHKSFDYLIQKYQLKMEDRYIIYKKDLKFEDGIMYIPIYMTMFL